MPISDDEKRELARFLLPAWAYDLTRSEILEWHPNDLTSGAAADLFLEQIMYRLRAHIRRGESFSIALIPGTHRGDHTR